MNVRVAEGVGAIMKIKCTAVGDWSVGSGGGGGRFFIDSRHFHYTVALIFMPPIKPKLDRGFGFHIMNKPAV